MSVGNRLHIDPNQPWVRAVSALLEPGSVSSLPWPLEALFVCQKEKLLYTPITKCACTSIKQLMVELSDIEHKDLVLEQGVHRVTDAFITGAKLKDYDADTVQAIIEGDEYYKFAVVREPVRRIISAYTEMFFLNRLNKGNLVHILGPLRDITRSSKPDLHVGITFRSFVEFLTASEPSRLDPHWIPQHLILRGVNRYNAVFSMDNMSDLVSRLSEITGKDIQLSRQNIGVADFAANAKQPGRLADVVPGELDSIKDISAEDFMAPDLVAALERYYQADAVIYRDARSGLEDYVPPVALASVTGDTEATLSGANQIARFVNLYSKGFFALDKDGNGSVPVSVVNTSAYNLDLTMLSACAIIVEFKDVEGSTLGLPVAQPLAPEIIRAHGMLVANVDLFLEPALIKQASTATLSLRFHREFYVEDIAPLHVALAIRIDANAREGNACIADGCEELCDR